MQSSEPEGFHDSDKTEDALGSPLFAEVRGQAGETKAKKIRRAYVRDMVYLRRTVV